MLTLALAATSLLRGPAVLHADPGTVSSLPWIFDGAVQASARVGDTLYVGGTFTAVAPSGNALPPVYALSEATGAVTSPLFPSMDGEVAAVEPDGAGGYFLGGNFTVVDSDSQPYLAHILADGSLDTAFRPVLDGAVQSLARLGSSLYFIEGLLGRTGAVSIVDGARLAWQPALSFGPRSLLGADDRIVISGSEYVSPVTSGVVGAYDSVTGALLWFNPIAPGGFRNPGSVGPILRAGQHVIVAHNRGGLSKLWLTTGVADPLWNPGVMPTAMALSGSTLYLGGSFTSVAGEPRQNLAAINVDTAAPLPWNPVSAPAIASVAATSAGAVYVSGSFSTFGGVPRHRLAKIDASGALTAWIADARPESYSVLMEAAGNTLLVSSSLTAAGHVARPGLAAFDLATGTILPWAPSLGPVTFLASAGARVWAGVSGALFVFDATTGAFVDFVGNTTALFADDRWIYRVSWPPLGESLVIERSDLATGVTDASWRPAVFVPESVAAAGEVLFFASSRNGLAAIDRRTARVLWTNASATASRVAVSGDTLYAFDLTTGLGTYDSRTGASIRALPNHYGTAAMTVADGRLVVYRISFERGLLTFTLDGLQTAWDPGLDSIVAYYPQGQLLSVAGDLLVVGGNLGRRLPSAVQGLAVFPLDGARAPNGLQARPAGIATRFTWNAPLAAPVGGYVLEAGTSPGQTLVRIPVGSSPEFSAVVPRGDFFVRVRTVGAVGGTEEVSNEVRVRGGCAGAPAPPTRLVTTLSGSTVALSWLAPDAIVASYTLEAGSGPGLADLATVTLSGEQTSFSASAPPGTYYVRVRATNDCGGSGPSGGVHFTIGAQEALPGAPSGLEYRPFLAYWPPGGLVWTPPPGPVSGYLVEAGSDVGLADLMTASSNFGPSYYLPFFVPPGTYVVRVRAVNAAGVGPPSEELVLRLGGP